MSAHSITVHIFMSYEYGSTYTHKEWRPDVWRVRVQDTAERIYIGPQVIDIDVPDDFDPTSKVVAALEAEKDAALEAYQLKVASINERLSKYLAITNEVEA